MNEEATPLSFSAPKIARGLVLENKGLREIRKGYYEEVWRNPQFGHDIRTRHTRDQEPFLFTFTRTVQCLL